MSKSILFWPDVYKEQGHWIPTLKWAQNFYDCNNSEYAPFDINYMGIEDCKSIISNYDKGDKQSFKYHTILDQMYPLGYTTESHSTPNERWKTWHIWAILYSQFAKEDDTGKITVDVPENFIKPNAKLWKDAKSIRTAWDSANPNLLVSGYFTSLETLLLFWIYKHRKNRKDLDFIITTTFLRHPQDDPAVRAKQNLQAFSRPELHKIINMAVNGTISTSDPGISLQEFVKPLESFDEMIPCPSVFDYSHYRHGTLVHYVEPCITREPSHNTPSKDSNGAIIEWDKELASRSNIIFVSAGSQVLDYEDKARNLFHSMCKAMQSPQLNKCNLIISAGTSLVNSDEWDSYDKSNIIIASWVPQRTLLEKGDVKCALIHGGLATIKECVYYNRNFVIHPMGKDQIDNALRLQQNGIDNMLPMASVNTEALLDIINRVTSDYRMKNKLKNMSDVFKSEENKKTGLNFALGLFDAQKQKMSEETQDSDSYGT